MKNALLLILTFVVSSFQALVAAEVNLVDESNRSKGFEAVASKLDLGGDLYYYMDTEGYIEEIANVLSGFMQDMQAMQVAQGGMPNPAMALATRFDVYGQHLGFFNIEAVGMSAYNRDGVYHCKTFVYQPEGRVGLFSLLGDEPHPLELLEYAPAGTDYFYSLDLSLDRLELIARNIVTDIMGEMGAGMLDGGLGQPVPGVGMTNRDLLAQLDTELALIVDLGEPQAVPQMSPDMPSLEIPQVSATIIMRNLAPLIDEVMGTPLAQQKFTVSKSDRYTYYQFPAYETSFPFGEGAALIATDSQTGFVYLSTSREYLDRCLAQPNGLAQSADFKVATKGLPHEGNGFNFISSDVYKVVSDLMESVSATVPAEASFGIGFYEFLFPMLGATGEEPSAATVLRNESAGTLVIANSPFRPSSGAGSEAQAPMMVGLMAAMAIPAFNKVRETSREKAVINNLRQFVSGGDQFMLEEGQLQATYSDIVGPDRYVKSLDPVYGEDYTELVMDAEGGTLTVILSDGSEISYDY